MTATYAGPATRSTHRCEVVRLTGLEPHPNADRLLLARVWGYQVVVAKDQWRDGDLGAYVVPDSLVPVGRPEFAFLAPKAKDGVHRVRAVRLRGVLSQGLLVPAPPGSGEGDDVAGVLGVTRYNPPEPGSAGPPGLFLGGEAAPSPPGVYPKYDLESWHRYGHVLKDGEAVVLTEKIHGCLRADSGITLADGTVRPISDVRVGDSVVSYDVGTSSFTTRSVTATMTRRADPRLTWIAITLTNGRRLVITSDHLVLTNNRGWVPAGELSLSDDLVSPS